MVQFDVLDLIFSLTGQTSCTMEFRKVVGFPGYPVGLDLVRNGNTFFIQACKHFVLTTQNIGLFLVPKKIGNL